MILLNIKGPGSLSEMAVRKGSPKEVTLNLSLQSLLQELGRVCSHLHSLALLYNIYTTLLQDKLTILFSTHSQ